MKTANTSIRTGGVKVLRNPDGSRLCEVYNSIKYTRGYKDVEGFILKNPPSKPSPSLLLAIRKAFLKNSSVTYNCGNGNQTFYFKNVC